MVDTPPGEPSTSHLRAAVLGSPIAHSKSPTLHRAAYAAAGLPWRYDAIEVNADDLPHFLAALGPRWVGLSLTMPLKEAALSLVAELSTSAARTSAVNTLVLPGSPQYPGRLIGYNTDVQGIVEAVGRHGLDRVESVEILGSGATARSALAAGVEMGASRVVIRARNGDTAHALGQLAKDWGVAEVTIVELFGGAEIGACDLTISTLPAGGADALASRVQHAPGALLDVVYQPWPTVLAAGWAGVVISGLEMLVCQAAEQIRLMAGVEPDVDAMRAAVGL